MNEYFMNYPQIKPNTINVFGINITSTKGMAWEILEMINFSIAAVGRNVAPFVTSVTYDSQAGICSFDILDTVKMGDPVWCQIELAAHFNISRYEWFGSLEDGLPSLGDA